MKLTAKLLPLSLVLAVGAPLIAYVLAGKLASAFALLLLGLCWWVGVYRHRPWLGNLCASGILLMVMVGSLSDLSPIGLLVGVLAVLAAWDMDHFRQRYHQAERVEAEDDLERRHLGRLALVLGIGGGVAGLALAVRLRLNFAVVVLLTLWVAIGLRRLVMRLRRQSD